MGANPGFYGVNRASAQAANAKFSCDKARAANLTTEARRAQCILRILPCKNDGHAILSDSICDCFLRVLRASVVNSFSL